MLNELQNSRRSLLMVVLELFFVILGVFIGLIANEWRLNQADNARVNNVLKYIYSEVKYNHDEILKELDYHKTLADSFGIFNQRMLLSGQKTSIIEVQLASSKGFPTPMLEFTGWEIAQTTGLLDLIDLELAVKLAKLYNSQEFCHYQIRKIGDNLYTAANIDVNDISNLIMTFSIIFTDFYNRERRLLEKYEEIMPLLEEYCGK